MNEISNDTIIELFGEIKPYLQKKWTVIYTKSNHEKKLAEWAKQNEIVYYLPLADSIKIYAYKKVVFRKPLFPGYFFTCCDQKEKEKLIISGHCVSFINIDHEESFLDDLRRISCVKSLNYQIEKHPYITKGMNVKFINGPLKGLDAVIENPQNLNKVILQVKVLKNAVAVSANASDFIVMDEFIENIH